MANQEHLAILAKGVEAWNAWRRENPHTSPDLADADLSGKGSRGAHLDGRNLGCANFSDANLQGADLFHADLRGANLIGAHLRLANLTRATLLGADLSGKELYGTNLSGAILDHANLSNAALMSASLSFAILGDARFDHATLGFTSLGAVDLSTVKGLESVIHRAPSTIGIDTIYLSKGRIPDSFLRGAGVPENLITYMKSLTGAAFDFYSCFISYSSQDQDFAERLHADLQAKGVRCWFAPEDLKIGDKFRSRIDESIRIHDKLLLVLSRNSITSAWVEKEVETAFERERREKRTVLFPIRLDDEVMETSESWAADIRRTRHIGNMTGWKDHGSYAKAFERLMRDLKAGQGANSKTDT